MKLVMTMLVRDESDIIRFNIEYHAAMGVDAFVIMDHGSSDNTVEIITELQGSHDIELRHQLSMGYYQSDWVSQMARDASSIHGADWVINNDADEFWWPIMGDLKSSLSSVPSSLDGLYISRFNYPPVLDDSQGSFLERMKYKDLCSVNSCGDPLPAKLCHRACSDVRVSQGNHDAEGSALRIKSASEMIQIFHFPIRALNQFSRKIINGGRAYESSHGIPRNIGKTWRELYEVSQIYGLSGYYNNQCLKLQAGKLANGDRQRYVEDTRLLEFISNLSI